MDSFHSEKIWDPVTRIWHWVLATVVVTGWCLGEFMSFTTIQWHFYCGYTVLALMAFRGLWGVVGPPPVRFGTLLRAPRHSLAYSATLLKRSPSGTPGHNPLGSISVLAMIALLTAQATSGLFIESDDFFEYGPLAHWVSSDTTLTLSAMHYWLSRLILAIVVLHIAVMFFYFFWKRENLVTAMVKRPNGTTGSDE